MKSTYIIGVLIAFLLIPFDAFSEKVVQVIVCGGVRSGYYVVEAHDYDNDVHSLKCTSGENMPCVWKDNPNTTAFNGGNFFDPFPLSTQFENEFGQIVYVDILALNNAINSSILNGNTSQTIVVNNVTLHYDISNLNDGGSQLVIQSWLN